MANIKDFDRCANCGACVNKCPVDAITLIQDDLFYKIQVNENCIDCGMCIKVCPENTVTGVGVNPQSAFAGASNNSETVEKSSSGGFFSELAEYVLSKDGIVWGAVYEDNNRKVVHASTENYSLEDIRRSKYTESNVGLSFRAIKEQLDGERLVLVCGTPCQIAGLICYLDKPYENLITCDFVCGGLASHKAYQSRLETLEKKFNSIATSVNFRAKILGWGEHTIKIEFENGKKYKNAASLDPYFWSFLNRKSIRENCYDCSFVGRHFSDFTIADFWQYKKLSDIPTNTTGLSLVGLNNKKAEELLKELNGFNIMANVNPNDAFPSERKSLNKEAMEKRRKFLNTFESNGLNDAAVSLGFPSGYKYIIGKMKYIIKKAKQ